MVLKFELVGRACEAHGDVVIADTRAHLEIKERLYATLHVAGLRCSPRATETYLAPFQVILRAIEIKLAFSNIGPSQQSWLGCRATKLYICIPGQTQNRGLHLQFGRGHDMHIEPYAVQQRVRRR